LRTGVVTELSSSRLNPLTYRRQFPGRNAPSLARC
jgi:hypothetical protein